MSYPSIANEEAIELPALNVGTFIMIETNNNFPTFESEGKQHSICSLSNLENGQKSGDAYFKNIEKNINSSCSISKEIPKKAENNHCRTFVPIEEKLDDLYDDNSLGLQILEERAQQAVEEKASI